MRAAWPAFKAKRIDEHFATWRGYLKPFLQSYEVVVSYRVPYIVER